MIDLELKAHDLTLMYMKKEGMHGFLNIHKKSYIEPEIYAEYYKVVFEKILNALKQEAIPLE